MKRNKFMGCFLCNNSKDDEVALKEKRRCVKILTFFFMPKAPTFTSWGFVIT